MPPFSLGLDPASAFATGEDLQCGPAPGRFSASAPLLPGTLKVFKSTASRPHGSMWQRLSAARATSQTAAAGIRARRARTRSTQRARAPGEALVALLQLLGLLLGLLLLLRLLRLLWPLCSHPVGVASHSFASQLLQPSQKPPASDKTQRVSFSECAKQQVAFWQSPPAPWSRYFKTTSKHTQECGSCGR